MAANSRIILNQDIRENQAMKNIFALLLLFTFISFNSHSQVTYSGKVESGFMMYRYRLITYDLGPDSDWKGYNLDKEQDGIDLNLVNGISMFEKRFLPERVSDTRISKE